MSKKDEGEILVVWNNKLSTYAERLALLPKIHPSLKVEYMLPGGTWLLTCPEDKADEIAIRMNRDFGEHGGSQDAPIRTAGPNRKVSMA